MLHLEVGQNTKQYELYENADYQSFWMGTQQLKLDELEQLLVRDMLHLPAKRIIDIGCGYGRLLENYQEHCDEIVLLDSSSSLLRQAYQKTNGKAICVRCDLTNTPFVDSSFDQVMMIRVFHHLPDSKVVLKEFNRLLINGGNLLFSYCNKKNIERIARWIIGKNPYNPFDYETNWVWIVFYMHHPRFVHDLLYDTGFSEYNEKGAGIVDKIAGALGKWGKQMPPGKMLAGLFANLALAPWIFCDAQKSGSQSEIAMKPLESIFRCTHCGSALLKLKEGFQCKSCGLVFPLKDGVYHFINNDPDDINA